jgi:Tol biopolymer transport system component
VFSGDGQAIVFQSARGPARRSQLYTVGVDGTGLRQLTLDSASSQPSVSPDGNTIAFISARNRDSDVWLMARDGSNQRAFTRSPQWRESSPQFLRDGALAYLVERREGNRTVMQVMKADLASGQTTPLTGAETKIAGFAVSPAGDLIALVQTPPGQERSRNPTYKVYIRTLGSGAPLAIPTGEREQMVNPTFLP